MAKGKKRTSISGAQTYREMGDYWDEHDLSESLKEWKPVEFEIGVQGESIYFPLESSLAAELTRTARKQGVSAETLINLWVKERVSAGRRKKTVRVSTAPSSRQASRR